jgi:lipoate-protein ligase B
LTTNKSLYFLTNLKKRNKIDRKVIVMNLDTETIQTLATIGMIIIAIGFTGTLMYGVYVFTK